MIKYNFICDLEFTNLDPMRGQIIECALLVTDLDLNVINQFHMRVRPDQINEITWQIGAQEIHGVTPEQAMAYPHSRREFCFALLEFLKPYYFECLEPQPFVCHAMQKGWTSNKIKSWPMIDYFMLYFSFYYEELQRSLDKIFCRENLISTIQMAKDSGFYVTRKIIDKNGRISNRKSQKLNLLCDSIGFELNHHSAMSDVYGCLAVMKHCTKNKELMK